MRTVRLLSELTRPAFLIIILLALAGCFRSAGDSLPDQPTTVDLTSIAPTQPPTPTAGNFVTPLPPGGFVTDVPQDTPVDLPTIVPATATPVQANNPDTPVAQITPQTQVQTPSIPATPSTQPTDSGATAILNTPTALPSESPCVHTVQPGEWMYSIARKFNVSYEDLLAANPAFAANPDTLKLGDVLKIPNCNPSGVPNTATIAASIAPTATIGAVANGTTLPSPIPVLDRIYTVASGDTLGAIARKFNTTVQAIKDVNGLTSDFLQVGQQLKIPQSQ